jgi:hypothetical protein
MSADGTTLIVRVIEYFVTLDGQTTPELFCLLTDLLDHHTHPADQLAAAYKWRWDGSETALREVKSTIHDTGPGSGAILRSTTPELVRQEHPAWIVGTELVRAAVRTAATVAAPFRKGPRTGQAVQAAPVLCVGSIPTIAPIVSITPTFAVKVWLIEPPVGSVWGLPPFWELTR